jgi:L-seryl-tRNA(Ser) seleniumtransferase
MCPTRSVKYGEPTGLPAASTQIPTLLDASADVPPVERMSEYCRMGFDLVAISGGKGLRGPNNTGLLLGRNDLIETAKLNTNPFAPTFGRMMKVGKEDMMAMLAAVERFVRLDHRAEWEEMERRIGVIERELLTIPTVECERIVPTIASHQPHLIIDWDKSRIPLSHQQVTDALMAHVPPFKLVGSVRLGIRGFSFLSWH